MGSDIVVSVNTVSVEASVSGGGTSASAEFKTSGPAGASAYAIWQARPGNEGKSIDDFIASLSETKISGDLNNRAAVGDDGGVFVPELTSDPLSYYILARS